MDKSDLHSYQVGSVKHIIDHPHAGLFLDMGLGKTVSSLTAIDFLIYEDFEINNALVVAPKRVAEHVWDAEVQKWDHLSHLKIVKIAGTQKQRLAALRTKADVYTIGRDNVAWLCGQYGGNMLPFDMLVIDESSSFKNPRSLRFKALRNAQPGFKRVIILTGTPAPNGLIDLWSQMYLLDRGERLGKFISHYREKYFKPGASNGHIVYKYNIISEGEQMIHDQIKDICISMSAKDYLDLPDVILNEIMIDMPEKIQKQYNDFERDQVLELFESIKKDEPISAVNAAALSNKLLQFANGAVYDADRDWHEVHDLKIKEIMEIIESLGGKPVLIAWTFRHDKMRLMKALSKYKPKELKDNKDIDDWNDGKIQVLLMHPASGGHGLNLQKGGNNIIWFGQTWSLELYQQLNARLARQGQLYKVYIHKLIMRKTIEQKVITSQKNKAGKQSGLMEAVKARIEKYLKL